MRKFYLLSGLLVAYMIFRVNIKTKYDPIIKEISEAHGNSPDLVKALIKVESNFNPKAHNKTEKEDSRGLGQINSPTAISLGFSPDSLFDPETNIKAMNKLLLDLKKRHDNILDLIASYNAGSVKLNKLGFYINSGYVLKVYSRYLAYSLLTI